MMMPFASKYCWIRGVCAMGYRSVKAGVAAVVG